MTGTPWSGLDAATQTKDLYLKPSAVSKKFNKAFTQYQESLQALINYRLDDIGRCCGTAANPVAGCVEGAFNSVGTTATNYCQQQLSQIQDFFKTATDAKNALANFDSA
jgi:hypothetical protein